MGSVAPLEVSSNQGFDGSRNIALVPIFWELEVDSYFSTFERIAIALNWPKDMWPILLQCKLVGRAQEITFFRRLLRI